MIYRIREKINTFISELESVDAAPDEKNIIVLDSGSSKGEPDMRIVGLFADVAEDKVA